MTTQIEHENKYLLNNTIRVALDLYQKNTDMSLRDVTIRQCYVMNTPNIEMRLREINELPHPNKPWDIIRDAYEFTVKQSNRLSADRLETTIELTQSQFTEMFDQFSKNYMTSKMLVKTRYYITPQITIDVYYGPLHGLNILEIEYNPTEPEPDIPVWVREHIHSDVTHDHRYKNSRLTLLESYEELL